MPPGQQRPRHSEAQVDTHPHTGLPTTSIHPCKHAQVMKKVIDDWVEQGMQPRHDLALFVFLKSRSAYFAGSP